MAHPAMIDSTDQTNVDELEHAYNRIVKQLPEVKFDRNHKSSTIHQFLVDGNDCVKFFTLLKKCPRLLSMIQDTKNEYTIFVPTDSFWEKQQVIQEATKEEIEDIVSMHISPHYLTTEGFLHMPNVPTMLFPPCSNGPQIIRARASHSRWELDHSSHVVEENILCSNGIVHKVDHILVPPPNILSVLESNDLRIFKKAVEVLATNSELTFNSKGHTVFAPTDEAFEELGKHITQFLLETESGLPYLRALVQLHVAPNISFYSNFIWPKNNTGARMTSKDQWRKIKGCNTQAVSTLLKNAGEAVKHVVTIVRFNCLISMYVNNTASVIGQDLATSEGVVQAINKVLLPRGNQGHVNDGYITLECFKDYLSPFINI